jgi:signal transduction histidine kinase
VAGAERSVILVVDDDPRNRALARAYLEPAYEVREATDGAEALVFTTPSVDLVILDVMMPGMSGFDVCHALKTRGDEDPPPVLLVTALSERDDRNRGLAAGADDFLSKPVDRQELLLRVRHFLTLRRQRRLLARQYEAMRELTDLKDDLVSLMVHDLRNPLTGVLGLLQILEMELDDPIRRADAAAARQAAERLRETLDDMLQVRLLEEGRLAIERQQEQVANLIEAAVEAVEGAARLRRLDLIRSPSPELVVAGDGRLLRRAIENLLSNAIKFSPVGRSVEIEAQTVEDRVEIRIADHGGGVPFDRRAELFHKFGGVSAMHGSDRRGFGLGLYFVRLVAEAHGGTVAATDRAGGGTVMTLVVPGSAPSTGE